MTAKKPGLKNYTDPSGFNLKDAKVTRAGSGDGQGGGKNFAMGTKKVTGKPAKGC